jgi:hypothetical protein
MKRRKWVRIALFAVAVVVYALPGAAAQRRVLLVQSYDPSLPWTGQCERGIRSALPKSVQLDIFYLDSKRLPPFEYGRKVDEALALFRRTSPDLVMLGDDNALRLLGPAFAATGVPVVYFGINNNPRSYFKTLPPNVVGIIERIPLFHWIRLLTQIMPNAKNILVLMDDSPTSKGIFDTNFMGRRSVTFDGRTVECELTGSWETWRELVLAGGRDFILMPIYHALQDRAGKHVDYETVVRWMSARSPVPVFADQDYAVGDRGVVGALVVVGDEHGAIAGRMAARILQGERIADLSTRNDQKGRLFFNKHQLARFGLVLPPDIAGRAVYK